MHDLSDLLDVRVIWGMRAPSWIRRIASVPALGHGVRCEGLVVSDIALMRLTASTRVFHGGWVVFALDLDVPREVLPAAELRVFLLIEEFLLGSVGLVKGALAAVFCLRLIHVVDGFGLSIAMWRGHACFVPVIRTASQVRLVHVLLADVRLEAIETVRSPQRRLINIAEVVLLGRCYRAILRGDFAPDGLVVLEELALCCILVSEAFVLRVHGILALEELLLSAFTNLIIAHVSAHIGFFSVLIVDL